jgi:translocation and assembly module TamB
VKKRIRIILITAAALLAIAVIGVLVFYRMGGLDWWFRETLRDELAEMNIRLVVSKTRVGLYPGEVVLEGLELYPGADEQPFASVEKLTAKFDITSLWSQRAEVRSLELVRPVVNVRFDAEGRSNLDAIDWPERAREVTRPEDERITYQMAALAIEDGQINYGDEVRRLAGTLDDVTLSVQPKGEKQADGSPPARRVELQFANSRLTYEGREVQEIAATLGADVTREGATVDRFELTSPLGTTNLAGTVRNWQEPEYDFRVASTVELERVGYVADPNAGLAGRARVTGRLTGKGFAYKFDGDLEGDDLLVAGVRIASLTASGPLQGDRLDYAWMGNLIASRLTLPGLFDASGVRFTGRVDGRGEAATAEGTFALARVAGEDFTATGVDFTGRVDVAARAAAGQVGLSSIALRTVRAGNIRARIEAEGDRVEVPSFTAAVYGGTVAGSATAQLGASGTSSLRADFRGVDLDQALGAASADAPRLDGNASGRVALTWPGANVRAATGTVRATVAGTLPGEEGGEALPLEGEIALTAVPGRFRIDTAEFRSGESRVTATGTVGWDRRSDIAVTAEAADGGQLLDLVSAANPSVGDAIRRSNVRIGGAFRFDGQVTGSLANPDVAGRVEVARVEVEGENLGAFTGAVRRDAGTFRLDEGLLRREDGGEVAFDFSLPARDADNQTVAARITRYPLNALFKAVPFAPPAIRELGGTLTGTVDVQVPEAGRALDRMLGHVDLVVEGATIKGEPVRELRFVADLDPARIALSDFRLATARGALTGTASFDKGSNVYRADFVARDVDLKVFEPAGSDGNPPPVSLAGTASGPLSIVGRADLENLRFPIDSLTADVAGTDVAVNGEPVGAARLTVETTEEGTEKVAVVRFGGDVRGERRELAGTIYVARTDFPFRFATSLASTDVTRLVAAPPEGVSTRVTGDVEVRGFLADLGSRNGIADRLSVEGKLAELALVVEVDAAGKRYELANRGPVVFTSTGGVLHFERTTFTGEGTELTLEGDLAMEPDATSNLTLAGDVNLALASSFMRDAYAAGVASLQATVAGTLANPRFSGFADVRDASLRVVDLPIALQNGNGRILFTANQALIDSFTAQSNGGRVRVDGGVLFAGLRPDRWRFGFDAEQIRVNYPEDVRSIVDGQFALQGNEQLQILSGSVNVRRAEFTRDIDINDLLSLEEEHGRGSFDTGSGATGTSPIRLDLTVEARDSLIIRNNLADVVASASLALTGPIDDPIIDGRATVTRGTINFRNGEYQVSRGVVRFPGRLGGDITFDMQAESEIRGYRVAIGLSGTPNKPYPVLRSEPPLPETQIVSLILTGDLGAEETTSQTLAQSGVGLASSLLSEAVSRSVERRTSRLFGINRFQIDPLVGGANPSARLTLGRQVNKNLSIIYSTNVTSGQEQVIQIEYRISDRFSVVATRDERGAYGVDFRVRKRF